MITQNQEDKGPRKRKPKKYAWPPCMNIIRKLLNTTEP